MKSPGATHPPAPPLPPPARGMLGAGQGDVGPVPPLPGQGSPPPPREGRGTEGGAPLGPYAARPQTTTHPLQQ